MQYHLEATKVLDPELYNLIVREEQRQEETLEMIASESIQSPQLLEINSCAFNNKTACGPIGEQELMGSEIAEELMKLTADRACRVFGADHANIQPYSGSTANFSVFAACLKAGDLILSMRPDQGSHPTHGAGDNIVSQLYRHAFYTIDPDTQLINYDDLERMARELHPKLIIAGGCAYSRLIDYARISRVAKDVGAYFMVDMAHQSGLIAAGIIPSPVPYADFLSSSTSKTICGPRSGFVLSKKAVAEQLDHGVHPGLIASLHLQTMACMAHTFLYASTPQFKAIMQRTVDNAKVLCRELQARGFKILSDGTDTHLLVIDMRNRGLSGQAFADVLEKIKLSVNAVVIPYDESPAPNGVRMGCTVSAQRGMGEEEMRQIADILDRVSKEPENEAVLDDCRKTIQTITKKFPLYGQYALAQVRKENHS